MNDDKRSPEERMAELEAELKKTRDALRICIRELRLQESLWRELPMGIDEDADEHNTCPDDACAHMGGLAVKSIAKVLQTVKRALDEK